MQKTQTGEAGAHITPRKRISLPPLTNRHLDPITSPWKTPLTAFPLGPASGGVWSYSGLWWLLCSAVAFCPAGIYSSDSTHLTPELHFFLQRHHPFHKRKQQLTFNYQMVAGNLGQ